MTPIERDRLHRAVRARIGIGDTMTALCERADISRSSFYSWTTSNQKVRSDPEWETFRCLAEALGMRMWELLREIEDGGPIFVGGGR